VAKMLYSIEVPGPKYSIVFEYEDLIELSEGLNYLPNQLYRLQCLINEALENQSKKRWEERMTETIEEELTRLYRERYNGRDVLLRLTPLEVEALNNLVSIGAQERRSAFIRMARREKRRFNDWEKHLCAMDRKLWQKIRDIEKLAFKEKA